VCLIVDRYPGNNGAAKTERVKKTSHKSPAKPTDSSAALVALRLQRLWLVWLAALFVATPLLPSEAAAAEGTGIVLVILWVVFLVSWCTAKLLRKDYSFYATSTTCVFGILLVLIVLSTIVMLSYGHARPMINTVWQWISFGIAFFLCREVLRRDIQRRAMVAVMLALAVCLSGHGFYQYFYSMPKTRADFEANPDAMLAEVGMVAPEGSPARAQFLDRLTSTEPLATFTLTNSLAGFLSPWLLLAIGAAWTSWRDANVRNRIVPGLVACAVFVAVCWILTKSRTAGLATVFGLGLMAIYIRRGGWRPDWRILAGFVAVPILLVFFGMIVGGLDMLVLTESAKSLQYRFEYWQATAAMIGDYPWFGCGPGNFQQYYTAYKLPAASETVADPHNFLLEVWATAGTPAALALLTLLLVFAFQVRKGLQATALQPVDVLTSADAKRKTKTKTKKESHRTPSHDAADAWFLYLGAAIGVLIAYFPCGFLVGYMPEVALFLVAFPVGLVALAACHAWVKHGQLSLPSLLCAVVVALINLLAAGGITFAGVSLTLWLLLAMSLNTVENQQPARLRPRAVVGVLVGVTWLLLVLCHQTAYDPVLRSKAHLAEAGAAVQLGRIEDALLRAAAADPHSSEPWHKLAALRHQQWILTSNPTKGEEFAEAVEQMLQRNPRYSSFQLQVGHWQLLAFRATDRQEHIQSAIEAYDRAETLYPNHSLGRAHAAWAAFLANDPQNASVKANAALQLDDLNPHREQKLAVQAISDPGPIRFSQQPQGPRENAKQTMRFLRSQLGSNEEPTTSND
jgi:O-antigen ligase/tetratricopeptide (TPR) repeat protein